MPRGQPQPRHYLEKIAYQWIPRPMGLRSHAATRAAFDTASIPSPTTPSAFAPWGQWAAGSERLDPAQDLLEARVVL